MANQLNQQMAASSSRPRFVAAWTVAVLLLAVLVLTDGRFDSRDVPLVAETVAASENQAPARSWTRIVAEFETGFPHSPTIVEHANGELQAMWFYGVSEAYPDVGLWSARLDGGEWGAAEPVLDRHDDSAAFGYRIHTIGNPVLFRHPSGETWLAYVNPSIGGWSSSRIALRRSEDYGRSWSDPLQLPTSPIHAMSSLVRTKPVPMEGGYMALPAYHEMLQKYAMLLVLDPDGRLVGQRRIGEGIQPELVASGDDRWQALLRPMVDMPRRIHVSESRDGGRSWEAPRPISLPNPSAPVCSVTLANGDTLIAYNDDERRRHRYALVHIDGESGEWRRLDHTLDPEAERSESSYCDMIQRGNGEIVMIYSDPPGRRIVEFGLTPAWLAQQAANGERIEP
jgi:predicted neuraminidase